MHPYHIPDSEITFDDVRRMTGREVALLFERLKIRSMPPEQRAEYIQNLISDKTNPHRIELGTHA